MKVLYRVRHITPSWTFLGKLKRRSLEKTSKIASIACPVLALVFTYNERFHFISEEEAKIVTLAIPDELFVAYIVAVTYAVASLLYEFSCPEELQEFRKFSDYKKSLPRERLQDSKTPSEALGSIVSHFASSTSEASNIGTGLTAIMDDYAKTILTPENSWVYLNLSRLIARLLISVLFGISILVTVVFIGWTAPKEVFRVHSLSDTLSYLL